MDVQIMKSGRFVSVHLSEGGQLVESVRCDEHLTIEDALELVSSYYGSNINVRNCVSYRDGCWYENPER